MKDAEQKNDDCCNCGEAEFRRDKICLGCLKPIELVEGDQMIHIHTELFYGFLHSEACRELWIDRFLKTTFA